MLCPNCGISFVIQNEARVGNVPMPSMEDDDQNGYEVSVFFCPECEKVVVMLHEGKCTFAQERYSSSRWVINGEHNASVVYPNSNMNISDEVPEIYAKEFVEAKNVLKYSPKASAALSRRILEKILLQKHKCLEKTLFQKVEKFLSSPGIPSYLIDSIGAVRNIGNMGLIHFNIKKQGKLWMLKTVKRSG